MAEQFVKYAIVEAKDGQTAAERYAAISPKDPYTFYSVANELYFGEKHCTNASDITAAINALSASGGAIYQINETLTMLQGDASVSGSIRNIVSEYIVSTPISVANGGTGATTAAGARENLGLCDTKSVTVSATASTGTFGDMSYTHTQVVSWTGMTANDQVQWYITSGSFDEEIGIASQSGQCTIYFGANPSTLTTLKLVANHLSV